MRVQYLDVSGPIRVFHSVPGLAELQVPDPGLHPQPGGETEEEQQHGVHWQVRHCDSTRDCGGLRYHGDIKKLVFFITILDTRNSSLTQRQSGLC